MKPAPPVITVFMSQIRTGILTPRSPGRRSSPVNAVDGDGPVLMDGLKIGLGRGLEAGRCLVRAPVEHRDAVVVQEGSHRRLGYTRFQHLRDVADLLEIIERLAVMPDIDGNARPCGEQLPRTR